MVDRLKELPPPEKRQAGWPKMCQSSWLETLVRWEEQGGEKTLTSKCVVALRHALEANLLYIEELEGG